jgi:excinuclease ABC subunit C
MQDRVRATEYERRGTIRDKIRAIERTMESQKMAAFKRTELDLVGLARQDNQAAIQLFAIRDGAMIGRDVFLLDAVREAPDEEVLSSFLEQFYARATSIPPQVLVPLSLPDAADLEAFLASRRDGPVHLAVPQRGEKRELMALATRNAGETLAREQARWLADEGKTLGALEELAEALGLPGPPLRIECYDISNVQGSDSVGSMVVFEEGRPRPGSTGGSRSGRSSGRTTSRRTRRCCGAASGGRRQATRAPRRRSAGRCPTS